MAPQASAAESESQATTDTVDALVVGGGTAGAIAAIQSARLGAKPMLIEAERDGERSGQTGSGMTPETRRRGRLRRRAPEDVA
ncbi:MAG: FAD-dependent oxidoreductase [Lentisphaerae bacterium]|nr:FAD-dependent oxidoreductase [Lentisphaerota bacterium]